MSNLLKSKILLGVMIVAVLVVGGLTVVKTASASDCTLTKLLKYGMTDTEVVCLQAKLGMTASSTHFGSLTLAATKAYQSANSLVADGIVGALTRAALAGVTPGTSFPAGCTSNSGFSTTTGLSCSATAFPAGCTSNVGFSPLTGVACSSGTAPEVLTGGAGDLTPTELSTPSSNTKVGEGDVAKKIYGVEYEADSNSDISITSVKITLGNNTALTGSDRLDRYAKNVSVWYNNAKVGSADASTFSEDSNVYTKSIAISGVVIKAGTIGTLYFAVDAISDIDSGNTGSAANTWTITVSSTRYLDASGVVTTDTTGSLANTCIFDTLSSTSDVELKVNLSSSTTSATTVKLSTTTDTSQVELTKFTMKAQGSAMYIDQIPVLFTTTEGSISDIMSNVTLIIGGNTYNETVAVTSATTITVLFDNLGIDVAEGATISGTILADMNDIEATYFDEGTTLNAAITSALVVAVSGNYIDVEDENGDQLVTGDRTGSAQGNTMTFRSTGVNVVMGTSTYTNTVSDTGAITQVVYTIPVAVTSFGGTLYLGQTTQLADTATASNAFAFVFQNSSAPSTTDVGASDSATLSAITVGGDSAAVIEGTSYRLDDGLTKHFIIEVTLVTPSTAANSYRVALKQVRTFATSEWTTALNSSLVPVENYQTAYKYITS